MPFSARPRVIMNYIYFFLLFFAAKDITQHFVQCVHAKSRGEATNAFIRRAVLAQMKLDAEAK